ncbi:MAG: DUF4091 domain-containing protein [Deltaproteobacteria bacterium]
MRRSVLALVLALPTSAVAAPEVHVYPDTIRFDLASGALLMDPDTARRDDPSAWRFGQTPLRIAAARDEVVAVQLVCRGAGTFDVRVEGLEQVRTEVFAELGIRIDSPSESGAVTSLGPGLYPDPLVPTSTITVPAAPGVGVVWIDMHVDRDAKAGGHTGTFTVGETKVAVELTVLDVTMPVADRAKLGTVNFGSLLEKERAGALLPWMQMAHAHRVDVEVMRMTPKIEDGEVDWQGWIDRVAPYIEGTAFTAEAGYRGPRAGTPVARWIIPHTDWWPTKPTKDNRPADPDAWSKSLAEWERRVEAMGWFGRPNGTAWILFVNGLDEPKTVEELDALASYEALLDAANLKDRARVWFRADGNFGPDFGGLSDEQIAERIGGAVDLWNMHGASNTAPIALLDRRRAQHGERAMFYASNSGGEPSIPPLVVDADIVGARAWAWLVYRYDLFGALNWEIDYHQPGCVKNPKCSDGNAMNLDATLIYRGEELGRREHEPIASMRLKVLRRGAQDVAIASLIARKKPSVAKGIARILVPHALGDEVPDHGRGIWSLDAKAYDRARASMLTRLGGGTDIPTSTIRTDGKATLRPQWWSYLGGIGVVIVVALLWWRFSPGARPSPRDRE